MRKNVFKVLFAIVLFLGLSSVVSAEETFKITCDEGVNYEVVTDSVNVNNSKKIVFDGSGTVRLDGDVDAFVFIKSGADIMLNLNGYKLSASGVHSNNAVIINEGKVIITGNGSVINVALDGYQWGNPVITNGPRASMIIDDGTYTRSTNGLANSNEGYIVKNLGNLIIQEGVIFNPGDTKSLSSLIVNGWNPDATSELGYEKANYDDYNPTMQIVGGTFIDGKRAVTTEVGAISIIDEGIFKSTLSKNLVKSGGSTIINGGTFTTAATELLATEANGTIEVINGDFSQDVSSYMNVDSESIKNDDGTYTVNFVYADYSKIDEIIEKVIDEGVDTYTKESITVLEQELEKVDWELGKSKQADVDKMADAVTKAYKQLKKIENPATNSNVEIIVSIILLALMFVGIRLSMKKRENNA